MRYILFAFRAIRPGEVGFVVRARVPQPSKKDYVVRPKWNCDEQPRKVFKKDIIFTVLLIQGAYSGPNIS